MAIKVIVGAGGTQQEGWISLEHSQLDIRNRDSWLEWFEPGTVDAVLSEHVLEHLYPDEARQAARNIYEMLSPGGYWRIAVPDGNNPDPKYQEGSRPGGPGQDRQRLLLYLQDRHYPDHKVQYSIESLDQLLHRAGFSIHPLEWFDSSGVFHRVPWRTEDGDIRRSTASGGSFYLWLVYFCADFWSLSLLVDAVK